MSKREFRSLSIHLHSQTPQCTSVMPVLGTWRQEDPCSLLANECLAEAVNPRFSDRPILE